MNGWKKLAGAALVATAALSVAAGGSAGGSAQSKLESQLAAARLATAKYVGNAALANHDGYRLITRMIPAMGYHYMNPAIRRFDVTRPPVLVYERHGSHWQLAALEWLFTKKPAAPPLPGARYGVFGAGCHYVDGNYVPAASRAACPAKAPGTGAKLGFWHPNLVTMHVWLWVPNPNGLYAGTNPRVG